MSTSGLNSAEGILRVVRHTHIEVRRGEYISHDRGHDKSSTTQSATDQR